MQVTKETRNACQFANEKSSVYERFPFILPYTAHLAEVNPTGTF
jgi:hypothetical protein